jgi:hypothetical protein
MRRATALVFFLLIGIAVHAPAGEPPLGYRHPFLGRPQLPAELEWLDQVRLAAYTAPTTDQEREQVLRDLDVDLIDWYCTFSCNRGNYMRTRGIRVAGPEEFEYQEALHLSKDDTLAIFGDNGIAAKRDGTPATFPPTMYGGSYFMCHNAPQWHEMVKQGLVRLVPFGHTIAQDNIGCPLNKGQGNFCAWCNTGFKRYLTERFSAAEIRQLGIDDLDRFNAQPYLDRLAKAGGNAAAIEDRLVREYIRFQYISEADAWEDMMRTIRAESAQLGLPTRAAYGNQYGGWGIFPFATALSSRADVVWIECNCFQPAWGDPKQAWSSLVYKIGAASGHFGRPVWTWPIGYSDNQYCLRSRMKLDIGKSRSGEPYIGFLKRFPVQLVLCEGLAEGGMVVMRPGDHPGTPVWRLHADYARFVSRNRALFAERQRYVNAAIIYSFPTWMWRGFSSLSVNHASRDYLPALARVLEEAHIPYEARIFGHPDVWDDTQELAALGKYNLVFLPAVDCLSDRQAKALRAFVAGGGTLVTCGPIGTRDEDFRPRARPVLDGLIQAAPGRVVQIPVDTMKQFLGKPTRAQGLAAIRDQLQAALADRVLLKTNAPATVWINSWRQAAGRRLAVHLLNHDADVEADAMVPARDVEIRLTTPERFQFDRVLWIPFGREPEVLPHRMDNGRVVFTVPEVNVYGVAVLTSGKELEVANTLDAARRVRERLTVALEGRGPCPAEIATTIAQAEQAFRAADEPRAATLAQQALTAGNKLLAGTIEQSVRAERSAREQTRAAASDAVRALDFGNGPAAPGWTKVRSEAKYDVKAGFGWDDVRGLRGSVGSDPDTLYGDAISGDTSRSFRVDLPNGDYVVTVLGGHPSAVCTRAHTAVVAQGQTRLLGVRTYNSVYFDRSFSIHVDQARLDLTFPAVASPPLAARTDHPNPFAWNVCGILVRRADASRTADCARNDALARGGLQHWAVIGPFDDRARAGMETSYAPERGVDLAASYPGVGGRSIAWQAYTSSPGIATVPFRDLMDEEQGVVAFAATRVFVPHATRARLLFGSTGIGQVWLNREPLLRDYTLAGLMADELVKPVQLDRGWNDLLVKVCSKWGGAWAFSASLLDEHERPIPGLRTSPSGDASLPPGVAHAFPLVHPTIEAAAGPLEFTSSNQVAVVVENPAPQPIQGRVELTGDAAELRIDPAGDPRFADLGPGGRLLKPFQVHLLRVSAETPQVAMRAVLKAGPRERIATTRLPVLVPRVRLVACDPAREPDDLPLDNMDHAAAWTRVGPEDVEAIETDPTDKQEGAGSLRMRRRNNGDGVENFGRIQRTFPEGTDWTAYSTLRYWVKVTDEDPAVRKRPICVVINNRDSGGYQALARHEVPVGVWTLIEDDLSRVRRDNVSSLVPHLYEANLSKRTAYVWRLDDMRLRTSPATQTAPLGRAARLYVSNPTSNPLSASLTLTFPEGWRADLPADARVNVPPKRAWCTTVRIIAPAGAKPAPCTIVTRLTLATGATLETNSTLTPGR